MEQNVSLAINVGRLLFHFDYAPFVPHLSYFMDHCAPEAYEKWMDYDFEWLQHCEVLFRIPGPSPGSDREVARAEELGIPSYIGWVELIDFLKKEGISSKEIDEAWEEYNLSRDVLATIL